MDGPWGDEFEIDADADWLFGFIPMTVKFTARALNGKPPFTFTWNFGDGSPEVTGESTWHFYDKVGNYDSYVTGRDATGATSRVGLYIVAVTPERYAELKQLDVTQLRTRPSPTATP